MKLIDGHDVIEHAEVNGESREFIRILTDYIEEADAVEPTVEIDAEQLVKLLREGWTIHSESKWIPCSERLPSEKDYIGDVVIWCTDKSIVGVGWYYESTKSWATIDDTFPPILGEVIAWMPLPSAYQGE